MQNLKSLVAAWRSSVEASGDLTPSQSAELEAHLLDAVDQLKAAGLASDEAFLIAVRRLGETDVLSAEFAKAYPHQRAHRMILWMLTGAFRGLGAPKCRQLERPVVRRRTAQCWSVEVAIDEQAYRDSGMLQWESQAGQTYVIEQCRDFIQGQWTDLQTVTATSSLTHSRRRMSTATAASSVSGLNSAMRRLSLIGAQSVARNCRKATCIRRMP